MLPISMVIMLILTFISYFLVKKNSKYRNLPLKIISIIVVMMEVRKQIRNFEVGFGYWDLPLHYCSLFVFFFPLAQFGNEKIKAYFKPVALSCAITVSFGVYIAPHAIIGNACDNILESFGDLHTFMFHHLVILYSLVSIVLIDYAPKKNDYKKIGLVMFIYGIIAIIASNVLDTNYCNFLYSSLDFLDEMRLEYGQILYTLFIFIAIILGTSLVSYWYYLIFNKINKKASLCKE